MKEIFRDMAVIIPFTDNDPYWKNLLQDLRPLPKDSEILMVGPNQPDPVLLKKATEGVIASVRYVESPKGRGVQLNTGVRSTDKNYFWFLHADSRVPRPALSALGDAFLRQPESLHYFRLQFWGDGPKLVGLNSLTANWRSRYLGMPFGDQGFAIRRREFLIAGGFSESEHYGEDHAFVWEARRKRIPLNELPAAIFTSARKYDEYGWGRVTRQHVYLTALQATRECWKLLKQRAVE